MTQAINVVEPSANTVSVNGIVIDGNQIGHEMQYHPAASAEEAYRAAVQSLVIREVLLQEAKRLNLDDAELVAEKNCEANVQETSEENAIRLLTEQEVKVPRAGEAACRQYYDSNLERFRTPPLLEASHILLSAHPNDVRERSGVKQLAEQLIVQLQKDPGSFKRLAREYSACPSKEVGGSLGQLSKGQTVPEFEKVVFGLTEGLSAYPVESRYGFHVVRVDRKVLGKIPDFDMVKGRIQAYLNERVERKALSQYVQILLGQADIKGIDLSIDGSFLLQ